MTRNETGKFGGGTDGVRRELRIAVVGLGYVGLPLAVEFGRRWQTLGFDINEERIQALRLGFDSTGETSPEALAQSGRLSFSSVGSSLDEQDVYVVAVPTPVDHDKRPDFAPLVSASHMVGSALLRGGVVIYESTVYPGATEEICVPVLERTSGLKFNVDFTVGYSPERINPGDRERTLTTIVKITSGSTPGAADFVDALYREIITAGTHKASSIKVAEAAKVVENTQRDANIALVNEFALIFARLGIDTHEVLRAAGTKWNFLPFRPGLVGGHCIGVDPYYLIQKALAVGYHPDVLMACRRINDGMGHYVASSVIKLLIRKRRVVSASRVLILGLTFKEDCSDLRNTRVVDLISELRSFGVSVDVYDPWADENEARREYSLELCKELPAFTDYDGIVVAVAHGEFKSIDWLAVRHDIGSDRVIYDIKAILPADVVDGRL
jgi:UDP-N-acetyl-D-glucosamine/UDP-N-acetyl-D-galactosamine dehydrogenase